jgi:hypothetical protein
MKRSANAPGPEPIFSTATPNRPRREPPAATGHGRGCSTWMVPPQRPAKPGPGGPRRIVSKSASRLSGLVTTRFSAHVSDSLCLVERSGLRREESYTTGHETGQTRGKLARRAQARGATALPDAARPAWPRLCCQQRWNVVRAAGHRLPRSRRMLHGLRVKPAMTVEDPPFTRQQSHRPDFASSRPRCRRCAHSAAVAGPHPAPGRPGA